MALLGPRRRLSERARTLWRDMLVGLREERGGGGRKGRGGAGGELLWCELYMLLSGGLYVDSGLGFVLRDWGVDIGSGERGPTRVSVSVKRGHTYI
jgi:hypothetical protein